MRRTELDTEGKADPGVPRESGYYFGHVISRIDRLDTLLSPRRAPDRDPGRRPNGVYAP